MATETLDASQRLAHLQQGDWQVDYDEYLRSGTQWLPRRVSDPARRAAPETAGIELAVAMSAHAASASAAVALVAGAGQAQSVPACGRPARRTVSIICRRCSSCSTGAIEIGIEVTDDARIERVAGPASIAPEDDLVVRAARALQQATGVIRGARIRVRKRIPLGGGLGGGSSDAATVLRVLNQLWGTGLDQPGTRRLIGLTLGSDVPVFLNGSSAWAEGRGERLTPMELPEAWYLIVHPGVAVGHGKHIPGP